MTATDRAAFFIRHARRRALVDFADRIFAFLESPAGMRLNTHRRRRLAAYLWAADNRLAGRERWTAILDGAQRNETIERRIAADRAAGC